MTIFIDIDPFAPHKDECSFWHGGFCDCHPDALAALNTTHCHECDFVNAVMVKCNCHGRCICERLAGCPCIEQGIPPRAQGL